MAKGQLVKNASQAYGYTYASLSDMQKAGINIPMMRTKLTENGEYVEWLDEKTNEWLQGAKVVPMELKGMNPAQAYGSALTYARRYTVQMAESVACDDDKNIETQRPQSKAPAKSAQKPKMLDFDQMEKEMGAIKNVDKLREYTAKLLLGKTDKQKEIIKNKAKHFADKLENQEPSDAPSDEELEKAKL